uniref:Uncharacterized protein n=1 Tax=Odontella aurita TaxID=265563 RepID=A0A7S4I4D4_9STRA|mmetsp:Transcript_19785/g.57414  ORF Transcript_19785/g.57414 Transcript_19785/m.57414 type:complete len:264 (+) Transcript_19785:509-1300(+)
MDRTSVEQCGATSEQENERLVAATESLNRSASEEDIQLHGEDTTCIIPTATAIAVAVPVQRSERIQGMRTAAVEESQEQSAASECISHIPNALSSEIVTATVIPIASQVERVYTEPKDGAGEIHSLEWWAMQIKYVKATLATLTFTVLCLSVALGVVLSPRACSSPTSLGVTDFLGVYEQTDADRGYWSQAEIVYDFGNFRWRVANGVSWSMHWANGKLRTGKDCPFGELFVGVNTVCDGRRAGPARVHALTFNGNIFQRVVI